MKFEVIKADILTLEVDAIVNPANAQLSMGGGLAKKIVDAGGAVIKEEAQKKVPLPVGMAMITTAGKLPCKYVIHAPTMEKPGETTIENVHLAMAAALDCADEEELSSLAVPGLGTGVGKVSYEEAAKVMVKVAKEFEAFHLKKVIFVAYNDDLFYAFKKALS